MGIEEVHVEKTDESRYGLGASMNNGLKYAWNNSSIALTIEDDWILERELDLRPFVKQFEDKRVRIVRLAQLSQKNSTSSYSDVCDKIIKLGGNIVFNNQVALRHKSIYDELGYYRENCSSDEQEMDFSNRFNKISNNSSNKNYLALIPKGIKCGTFDDSSLYFIHVGESTVGHTKFEVPERYKWIL